MTGLLGFGNFDGKRDFPLSVSDIHTVRNEWPGTIYPNVPGHEIVGRVTRTGSGVTKFKAGGLAAAAPLKPRKCWIFAAATTSPPTSN